MMDLLVESFDVTYSNLQPESGAVWSQAGLLAHRDTPQLWRVLKKSLLFCFPEAIY